MDIKMLDVNQCNGDYHTPNAFKRTHKCDERTSYVSEFMIFHKNFQFSFCYFLDFFAGSLGLVWDFRVKVLAYT